MPEFPEDIYFDSNGVLTARTRIDGMEVIIHYDDVPDSDLTTVRGIPCTTPLRTVIDLAPDLEPDELLRMVDDCLRRRLFTTEEAMARLAQPDMLERPGAVILRSALPHHRPS